MVYEGLGSGVKLTNRISCIMKRTCSNLHGAHTHAQALVTPLGALFWSLFQAGECGRFSWGPHADSLTYFSIGGIAIMVPAIYFYNIGYVKTS